MHILLVLLVLIRTGYTQSGSILASGRVTNAVTGASITAVVTYRSLPTGGLAGKVNDSIYSFTMFGSAKYQIAAEAAGFLPRTIIIGPKEANYERKVNRDIPLTPEGQTMELRTLNFELSKATILPESYPELDEVVAMMTVNTRMVIQLEGHTDIAGDAKMNMSLSRDRVDAVRNYLIAKGIAKSRIKTKAFGGTQPLTTDRTPEAQQKNRRVEVRVLEH